MFTTCYLYMSWCFAMLNHGYHDTEKDIRHTKIANIQHAFYKNVL